MSIPKVLKIAVCGASAVGKSSISCRLAKQEPDSEHVSTIGVDYFALKRLPDYNARIGIWDLGGDRTFESITVPYINSANLILYVYDLTRSNTVLEIRRLYTSYKKIRDIDQIKSIVIGNKKDKKNVCSYCNSLGEKFANDLGAPHMVVSAKKNQGINELLSAIVTEMNLEKVVPTKNKDNVRMCDNCFLS